MINSLIAALCMAVATTPIGAATIPIVDGSLYYRVGGEGAAILLLNGGPGRSGVYLKPVFDHLATSYRVILPDQRGTGRSTLRTLDTDSVTVHKTVADLEALRVALGIERWTIIGHSWGGMLAMAYAATHPDNIQSLVLVGSGGTTLEFFNRSDAALRQRQTPDEINSIKAWEKQARDPLRREEAFLEVKKLKTGAYLFDRRSLAAVKETLTPQTYNSQTSELIMKDLGKTRFALATGRRARAIGKRPVLILHGDEDAIGIATERELSAAFPAASLRVIPRCGHYPWIEAARLFYSELDTFLGEMP